ncbi:AAA family ATPase [Pseudomonas sp. BF-B-28]|uniref:AAA family ATPase n=1 Tax=Pseudomonas sp. BF-B-28 TaxID=2832353 RepID=UPI001CBE7B22|nr:AAA family ATPase [Pseudomonas sp. BF-B-28]
MNTDKAFSAFLEIKKYAEANSDSIITEQDARFQLIDRFLIEVLGWPRESFKTEPHLDEGRIDYLLQYGDRNRFVIEAKRSEISLVTTKQEKRAYYKYDGPAAKNAQSTLRQAEMYCLDVGVQFCALTNGYEWIGHWPIRGDGRPKKDYKVATFPNLKSIEDDFSEFYELFSMEGVTQDLYKYYFHESEGMSVTQSELLQSAKIDSQSSMMKKTDLARDIDKVFSSFFSSMSGDHDPDMLINCFVESKESKETDIHLEKIAKNIVDSISYVDSNPHYGLEADIRDAVASERGEFALIIGNKGAGKSTYIDRFFKVTLKDELRSKCLVLKIDLRDSSGSIEGITAWLDTRLASICEQALFPDEPKYDDLRGVYWREYKRWSTGEMKELYVTNKSQFKIDFGKHINKQRLEQLDLYLSNLLWHCVGARQLMPCLVFDNADHFSREFQEAVFQYAQAIFRSIKKSFVICPVTDRTIWQLSKHGPFQSYNYKAFYLPTPSTKEILQKRAAFVQTKLSDNDSGQATRYFLTKGIRVGLQDLKAFVACIETIFIETEYISRLISSLCNFDIRRSLELTRKTLVSPHIAIEDLIKTYMSQGHRLRIPTSKIKKAIYLGDYTTFSQEDNAFILNMYAIHADHISSPLARLSIMQVLKNKSAVTDDIESKYLEVNLLMDYLEPIGFARKITRRHLDALFSYRLIEAYDPTMETLEDNTRVKITPSGLIHIELASDDATYVEHVGLSTPIRSCDALYKIRNLLNSKKLDSGDWAYLAGMFVEYLVTQDEIFCPGASALNGQGVIRSSLRHHFRTEVMNSYRQPGV